MTFDSSKTPVDSLQVDFNNLSSNNNAYISTLLKIGDVIYADDNDGLRCKAMITKMRWSRFYDTSIVINLKVDTDTFEDLEEGKWIPRKNKDKEV